MTKLTLSLRPQTSGKNLVYNYCECDLKLTFWKPLKRNETYSITLYNSMLMLLDTAMTDDDLIERCGKTVMVYFAEKHIWIPGKYFILLRDNLGNVTRHDLRLDEAGLFHSEGTRNCPRMSDEDMLSGRLLKKSTHWMLLSNMPGTMQLKRWAIRRAKLNELNELRENMQGESLKLPSNLLISTRTTCSTGPYVTLLMHVGEVESDRKFCDLTTFFDPAKNNPYEAMNDFFSDISSSGDFFSLLETSSKTYTFVFSGLSALLDTGGKTIMKTIQAHWGESRNSAVFCGSRQETTALLSLYPTLQERLQKENRLEFEHYTLEELIHTFFHEAKVAHLSLSEEAVEKICRLLTKAYNQGSTTNWDQSFIHHYIEQELMPNYIERAIGSMEDGLFTPSQKGKAEAPINVLPCDIADDFFLRHTNCFNKALEELHNMVGLTDIKQSIRTLTSQMSFFQERRSRGLHTTAAATHHIILTGNPGTGKTTVARLLGKIYHSLGILSKGNVVYADRSTIVGRYIGETEENMRQLLKEARGNVLFIDEAYTLYTKGDERDFGRHAVECLLNVLSQEDPDMLVVFAGYKREMDALMSMNQGLVGRFPYKFHFPDYSAEELMQIAEKMLSTDRYQLTGEARSLFMQTIRDTVRSHSENFANARWVEQFVRNGIIPALAERVTSLSRLDSTSFLTRIEAEDVRTAMERFNPKNIELKRHTAIGFCA